MSRWRRQARRGVAVALSALLWLPVAARSDAADDARAMRGRAIYEGRTQAAGSPAACASCHRRSGLGNFEGGLIVPPIAARYLFQAQAPDTSRFATSSGRQRVRPAYDELSLGVLLRSGVTPDGLTIAPSMPRYAYGDAAMRDLGTYLRTLSAGSPPGLDAQSIRIATVTTPDVDPARREAMLSTLRRFVEQKNSQTRHEVQRARQAAHTREMLMYLKFRAWQLEHWALVGAPDTWLAQLEARQRAGPVFALVAGMGRGDWAPVDEFCERARVPCLLPLVDAGAAGLPAEAFYPLHYHDGIAADAALAAQRMREQRVRDVTLWFDEGSATAARRVAAVLEQAGLRTTGATPADASAVVSVLAPQAHRQRLLATPPLTGQPVAWLPGSRALSEADLDEASRGGASGWIVTPMRSGRDLERQVARTRTWLRRQGLDELPLDVAASTLHAATVLGDALKHIDFDFTPEYVLELLEHGLEGMVSWSPYPRLAIGPGQRVASKGSFVGTVGGGQIDWAWQSTR